MSDENCAVEVEEPEGRYTRQQDIVPLAKLDDKLIEIIGVGAIGRQVANQLAAMGAPNIKIIDFDTVEEVNLAAQGFRECDLGITKVKAVSNAMKELNSALQIEAVESRFRKSDTHGHVIFACVDDIDTRKFIWEAVEDEVELFVDGRMAAEVLRVLSVSDKDSAEYYPTTFFQAAEGMEGTCTAKTTIYSANFAAAIMVSSLTRWLRDVPLDKDICFNLLTMEMDVI